VIIKLRVENKRYSSTFSVLYYYKPFRSVLLIILFKRSVQLNPGRVIPKQKSLRKQHQLELIVWLCNPFLFSLHLFREYVRAYFLLSNIFSSFHPKFFSLHLIWLSSACWGGKGSVGMKSEPFQNRFINWIRLYRMWEGDSYRTSNMKSWKSRHIQMSVP